MRILHTSDWHLGLSIGQLPMTEDQAHICAQMCEVIRRERVDLVLCAGDIFDSSRSNPDALMLYDRVMSDICEGLHVPVVAVAGNHDSAAQIGSMSRLVAGQGLTLRGRLTRDIEPVCFEQGHVRVYPLPWFGSDEVMYLFPEHREEIAACRNRTEAAMRVVCDHIREGLDARCVNILVAHAFIVDAATDGTDHAASVGTATSIARDVFGGFNYVALGHIHRHQRITERMRYCGSPLGITFGREEKQEKGVVILDTDDMSQTFVPLTPLRRFVSLCGTRAEVLARTDIMGDYLSIKVTDRVADLELRAELLARFPHLVDLHGMETESDLDSGRLTIEELEEMREEDILTQFFQESGWDAPEETQLALFRAAMDDVDGEV